MSSPTPGPDRPDDAETRKAVLAASAPWLAAVLNLLPGLGSGYIYQRRWRAWWITTAVASAWFGLGALLDPGPETTATAPVIGLGGLLLLALITMGEAFLTGRKARMD